MLIFSSQTRLQQKHANESNEPNLVMSPTGCAAIAKVNYASVYLSIVGAEKTGIQKIEEWRLHFHAKGALLCTLKVLILCTDLLPNSVTNTTGERISPAWTTPAWCMTRYARVDLTEANIRERLSFLCGSFTEQQAKHNCFKMISATKLQNQVCCVVFSAFALNYSLRKTVFFHPVTCCKTLWPLAPKHTANE